MDKHYNRYEQALEFFHLENTERLLLKAAIQEKPYGTDSINEWQGKVDLNTITDCSIELFPFLYFKYRLELNNQFKNIFVGTYRKSFYKNNIILKETCRLSDLLKVNGIPCIWIKGIPRALRYYGNLAIRPMRDSDIIVHHQDFQRAIEIALQNGFFDIHDEKDFSNIKQIHLCSSEFGMVCDLHREIANAEGNSDFLWVRAETYCLSHAASFLVPSAIDELILTLTHDIFSSGYRTYRWIIDAYLIIKFEPAIDWDVFIAYAEKMHFRIHLLRTLCYLKKIFDISIPEKYYQKLVVQYPSVKEIRCFAQLTVDVGSRHNFFGRFGTYLNEVMSQCRIFKVLYGGCPRKLRFYTSLVLILLELPRRCAYNRFVRFKDYFRRLFKINIEGKKLKKLSCASGQGG